MLHVHCRRVYCEESNLQLGAQCAKGEKVRAEKKTAKSRLFWVVSPSSLSPFPRPRSSKPLAFSSATDHLPTSWPCVRRQRTIARASTPLPLSSSRNSIVASTSLMEREKGRLTKSSALLSDHSRGGKAEVRCSGDDNGKEREKTRGKEGEQRRFATVVALLHVAIT